MSNRVNLEAFMQGFFQLKQNITEVCARNNTLEMMLEDVNRQLQFSQDKVKNLIQERNSLLASVNIMQKTLEEQMSLRAENERLNNDLLELKQQNNKIAQDGLAEVQQLVGEMRSEAERHQGELETVRQQFRTEVEDAHKEAFNQMEAKDAEVKDLLKKKDLAQEEMKKQLKQQEREKQSELLKLQMEFGAELARVQNTAQWSQHQQQQQQGSNLLTQKVFKRKLQFFQEEKNREIEALRQRIKELETHQHVDGYSLSCPKKGKTSFA